jgi:hypothetical protein
VRGAGSCQNDRVTAPHSPSTQRVSQPGREEAVVRAGEHPVEHEQPEDWGWHGETGKWGQIGGWFSTVVILLYLVGNHEGRVEDIWLVALAGLMALVLIWDLRRKRTAWRR